MKKFLIILFIIVFGREAFSQSADSSAILKRRSLVLISTATAVTASSLVLLNELWYKDFKTKGFHFFNDNNEWMQMDKWGHTYSTYHMGLMSMECMRWAGAKKKNAVWIGSFVGTAYMTGIELLDGFSEGWGFSWGDMGANVAGSLLVATQQQWWNEQRVAMKFSFRQSVYPKYRPDILGRNFGEQIIKDYNAQLYWLSVNVKSFLKSESKFPSWLNVAFGFGAGGMTGGHSNPVYMDANGNTYDFLRQRRFLFSLDADLTRIKTKSVLLKKIFRTLNILKVPFPAVELIGKKTRVNYWGI